jgi:hypothetical protein
MGKVKHSKKIPAVKKKTTAKAADLKTGVKVLPVQAAAQAVPKIKVMVASSVHNFKNELHQICAMLKGYGYDVLNSDIGTIYPPLSKKDNIEAACLKAVADCDIFLGIICPFYGTSGITHKEFTEAIRLDKPRRFICHSYVTFSRKLLEQFMYTGGVRTKFKIHRTAVMDDVRVIDMYNDAVQNHLPEEERKYRWVQEYFHIDEAFRHLAVLFGDIKKIEVELANFNN